jgi:hypothetical protein
MNTVIQAMVGLFACFVSGCGTIYEDPKEADSLEGTWALTRISSGNSIHLSLKQALVVAFENGQLKPLYPCENYDASSLEIVSEITRMSHYWVDRRQSQFRLELSNFNNKKLFKIVSSGPSRMELVYDSGEPLYPQKIYLLFTKLKESEMAYLQTVRKGPLLSANLPEVL